MARVKIEYGYRSGNYSAGRPYGPPNVIVIHHWGSDGAKFDGVCSWLCRKNGTSSAHFVVEAGRVAELVSVENRAWHAGTRGNPRGIGIECRPEKSAGDFDTVASLIADLRDRYGELPLARHCDYMQTDCPGRWGADLARLSIAADAKRKPQPTPTPGPLIVDGYMGRDTVSALQRRLSTKADGIISSQYRGNKIYMPNVTAVEYSANPLGSLAIVAWQKYLNAHAGASIDADGHAGPRTWQAVQRHMNGRGAGLVVDGVAGARTIRAVQEWLNA